MHQARRDRRRIAGGLLGVLALACLLPALGGMAAPGAATGQAARPVVYVAPIDGIIDAQKT